MVVLLAFLIFPATRGMIFPNSFLYNGSWAGVGKISVEKCPERQPEEEIAPKSQRVEGMPLAFPAYVKNPYHHWK